MQLIFQIAIGVFIARAAQSAALEVFFIIKDRQSATHNANLMEDLGVIPVSRGPLSSFLFHCERVLSQ